MCDYIMDPSGDVIFMLNIPNTAFALWNGGESGPLQIEPTVKSEFITEPTSSAEDNTIAEVNPISEDQQPATHGVTMSELP
jgi:hypothetical protein